MNNRRDDLFGLPFPVSPPGDEGAQFLVLVRRVLAIAL